MKCSTCGGIDNPFFIVIGDQSICNACAEKQKSKDVSVKSNIPTQFFTQYICRKHKCGTTNVNQISRHLMPDCDIIEREVPSWHKPKTFGGHNGDINRKFYVQECDIRDRLMGEWSHMVKVIRAKYGLKNNYQGGGNNGVNKRRRRSRD